MNLDINKIPHFKLYILIENRFKFEEELRNNGIEYLGDVEKQIGVSHSIRYYLKEADREIIDDIIVKNGIDSGIESTGINRYEISLKPVRALILSLVILVLIVIGVSIIFSD